MTQKHEVRHGASSIVGHNLSAEEARALGYLGCELDAIFERHREIVRVCHASGAGAERRIVFVPFLCVQPVLTFPAGEFVAWPPDKILRVIEGLLAPQAA